MNLIPKAMGTVEGLVIGGVLIILIILCCVFELFLVILFCWNQNHDTENPNEENGDAREMSDRYRRE